MTLAYIERYHYITDRVNYIKTHIHIYYNPFVQLQKLYKESSSLKTSPNWEFVTNQVNETNSTKKE